MIRVKLYENPVGIVQVNDGIVKFQYSQDWQRNGFEVSPLISPVSPQVFSQRLSNDTFRGLPSFIADALPDKFGNKVIDAFYAQKGLSPNDISIEDRLSYLGNKAMGALSFEPIINKTKTTKEALEISNLVLAARNAINGNIDEVTQDLIEIGSSAGGARPKAVIGVNSDFTQIVHGHSRLPESFDHYLIKFDGVDANNNQSDPKGYTNIEYTYHLLARLSGIDMMDCHLLKSNGLSHFLTKRFDRNKNRKIHSTTLCGLSELDFNLFQSASYSDYFNVVNLLALSATEKEEAFRRMVFNVVGVNRDDHTKNFSFLLNPSGAWSLAPAYDLTHAYNELNPNAWTREHNLLINGKGLNITLEDLFTESESLSIPKKKRLEIVEKVVKAFDSWQTLSKENHVLPKKIDQIQRHIKEAIKNLEIDEFINGSTRKFKTESLGFKR